MSDLLALTAEQQQFLCKNLYSVRILIHNERLSPADLLVLTEQQQQFLFNNCNAFRMLRRQMNIPLADLLALNEPKLSTLVHFASEAVRALFHGEVTTQTLLAMEELQLKNALGNRSYPVVAGCVFSWRGCRF